MFGKGKDVINKFFGFFTLFYFSPIFILLLVPGAPEKGQYIELLILNIVFYLIFSLTYWVGVFSLAGDHGIRNRVPNSLSLYRVNLPINRVVWLLVYLSIIGLFLICFDRIYIRGIDYSQGLRSARYQWLASSSGGLVGVVGNLLVSYAYAGLFLSIAFFARVKYCFISIVVFFFCVAGHAALNGGRSNLLMAIFVIITAFILRPSGNSREKISNIRFYIFVLLLASFLFVSSVVTSSARMGGVDLQELLYLTLQSFSVIPDENYFSEDRPAILNMIYYIFAYLYHGSWSAQVSMVMDAREGYYTLSTMPVLLLNNNVNLGLNLTDKAFDDVGAFITLHGALYYDYGWFGVVLGAMFFGLLSSIALTYLTYKKRIGLIVICAYVFLSLFMLMAQILPAFGLVFFYYVLFALLSISVITFVFFGRRLLFYKIR